jgi:peroxiredoxin Q/BCP
MFYPAVESPGCTLQACQLRDAYAEVSDLGVEVFGVSRDTVDEQAAFAKHHRLSYPMLSDTSGNLHSAFGISRWAHPFAIISNGRSRSTFVIGPEGKIEAAWYGVQSVGHATRLVNFLRNRA